MRHYDPWVFGLLWEIEHRDEMGRLARARQARQAATREAAQSLRSDAPRYWSDLGQLVSSITSIAWLRFRRRATTDPAEA